MAARQAPRRHAQDQGLSDIQGTAKKPWRQKGTGRARQGSLRSPQFRGGAVIFGPVVRSHEFGLQKKVRRLALKTRALGQAKAEGKLVVLDAATLNDAQDPALATRFAKLGWELGADHRRRRSWTEFRPRRAQPPEVDVLPKQGANVYDILRRDTLVLTRDAVQHLEARLAGSAYPARGGEAHARRCTTSCARR